jgi:hypothetical protein
MHLPLEETKGFNILDPRQLLVFAQDTSREGRAKLATAVSGVFERADINETEQKLASNILMNNHHVRHKPKQKPNNNSSMFKNTKVKIQN